MSQHNRLEPIAPSRALYIKLGREGKWEHECIYEQGTLRLSYFEADHNVCLSGHWDDVQSAFIDEGTRPGTAARHVNQIREFYEADSNVLWITFHADKLWWCFSEPRITLLPDNTKIRPAIGGWKCTDIRGEPLAVSGLSGRLLGVQGFRGTICKVREFTYLVNKINGQPPQEVQAGQAALDALYERLEVIICHLHWRDFEILIDLIFRQAGWQRVSELGGKQKTIDLVLYSPITQENYAAQIKSSADHAGFESYRAAFEDMREDYKRFYFIVHTPADNLTKELEDDQFRLMLPSDIARRAVEYGLTEWVISKAG